jgi:hypothetical protein
MTAQLGELYAATGERREVNLRRARSCTNRLRTNR